MLLSFLLAGCGENESGGVSSVTQIPSCDTGLPSDTGSEAGVSSKDSGNSTSVPPAETDSRPAGTDSSAAEPDSGDSESLVNGSSASETENDAASSEIVFSDPLDDPRIDDGWTSGWR